MLSLWGRHYCTALHSEATTEDSKLGDNIKERSSPNFFTQSDFDQVIPVSIC